MPLTPSSGIHFGVEFTVEKDDARVISPRTTEKYHTYIGVSGNFAMMEDIAALFVGIVLALGRQIDGLVRNGVDLTMIKHGSRVTEDKIYVAFDVAVFKVLPCRDTGSTFRLARAAGSIERILRAKEAHIAEDCTITVY